MSVHEKMTAIADAIREKTGGTDALTLDGMAAAIPDVHAAGAKSEYDRFWDAYQENGNRTNYKRAFSNNMWTAEIFKPKYAKIQPTDARELFYQNEVLSDYISVLDIDFSACTDLYYTFRATYLEKVGVIDCSSASTLNGTFGYMGDVHTIEEIVSHENLTFVNPFLAASRLVNIKFSGVIAQNGLNLQWSTKLSHDSIVSIIHALSTSTAGLSVTLSETAVNNAFTAEEWEALIATKPNWTINLV